MLSSRLRFGGRPHDDRPRGHAPQAPAFLAAESVALWRRRPDRGAQRRRAGRRGARRGAQVEGAHQGPRRSGQRLGLRARDAQRRRPRPLRLHGARLRRLGTIARTARLRQDPVAAAPPRRHHRRSTCRSRFSVSDTTRPFLLCPVGAQQMFNPEGEVAVARAAKTKNALQVLSTVTNYSVEDVTTGPCRAGLVSALSDLELGRHARHDQARRACGLHRPRAHRGHAGAQPRADRALQPRQRPALPGVPFRGRNGSRLGTCSTAWT